ncbi:MAG: hypothetical protein JXA91_07560 [Candidatus Thermoplasmatota archaeon]|nr:hypothetical protein [Candidatus Thermoplasmatota archaeon]
MDYHKLFFKITYILLCLIASFFVVCSKQSPTDLGNSEADVSIRFAVADNSSTSLQNIGLGKVATIVKVTVTVTGPGIETPITKSLQIVGKTATGSIKVPQGNSRTFLAEAKDENDVTQAEGARTINITGTSATVDINLTKILPTPSALRVVGDPRFNLVELAWEKNNDVDFKQYELYRSTTVTRPDYPLAIIDDENVISYSDSTVEELRTYTYWLNTVDTEGYQVLENSDKLPRVTVPTPANPTPQPVTVTKVSESQYGVKISWTRSEAANFAYYVVLRSENSPVTYNDVLASKITDRNTTTYTDNTVEGAKLYYYAVYVVGRNNNVEYPSIISNEVAASTSYRVYDFLYYDGGTPQIAVNAHSFGDGGGTGDLLMVEFTSPKYPCIIDSIQLTFQTDGTPGIFSLEIFPTVENDQIRYSSGPLNEPNGARRKNFRIIWGTGEGEADGDFLAGIRYLSDGTQPALHADTTDLDSSRSLYYSNSSNELYGFPNGDLHFHIRAHINYEGGYAGQWIAAKSLWDIPPISIIPLENSIPFQAIISHKKSEILYKKNSELYIK